jgi:hypothetical protein
VTALVVSCVTSRALSGDADGFDVFKSRFTGSEQSRGIGTRDRHAARAARPTPRPSIVLAPWPLAHYRTSMCRSIKTLRRAETAATTGELEAAARQYVRKISGYRTPSARNSAVFEAAVADVTASSRRLMEALGVIVQDGPDPMDRPRARRA